MTSFLVDPKHNKRLRKRRLSNSKEMVRLKCPLTG
jgi:hypothetical protein